MNYNQLNKEEIQVIINKGTQQPFLGKYYRHNEDGIYTCKQCDKPLYKSNSKFESSGGWPSFDDEIKGAVKRVLDADGRRVEIVCANCGGHLGHVFEGEQFTAKNTRHCVNSISLNFEPNTSSAYKTAYFAGGCFWGVEYHFEHLDGVISAVSGYMGGDEQRIKYEDICTGTTGHYEVVEVTYNPNIINYEILVKLFFEIHNPEQKNGQGGDIGSQYLSAIFYETKDEKEIIEELIAQLELKNCNIATKLIPFVKFFKAEEYHQDYYQKKNTKPYCHTYIKRFD
jgi:peptide methionine sulfoxide reductase msrA/msrB